MNLNSFFRELKRRNIYKVAVVYAITGWVVVQAASIATNAFGAPPWVLKMIIFAVILGFPLAMVFTWAFEVTSEGVRRTPADETYKEINEQNFWVGTGIVVILLVGAWWYVGLESATDKKRAESQDITDRSIAVLPLKSMGGGDNPLPLAEGLHDDLLTRLANVSELKVISRTSVEKFRDTDLTLPAIADSLNVRWILEGGVQKGENKVQINAQLIDPITDAHIWAETYQRNMNAKDVFAIQGEIAREISQALQAEITADEQKRMSGAPTANLEAYRLYVQGRQELAKRSFYFDEHVEKAIQYFQQAIRKDSSFALAWTGLADAVYEYPTVEKDTLSILTVDQKTAAQRALKLNPDLAEAHTSVGYVHMNNMNTPEALQHLNKAVELKPSYWEAHQLMGWLYFHINRPQRALEHLKIATELNPNHARARHGLYDAYLKTGQPETSLRVARTQQQMGLENEVAVGGEVRALNELGRYEESLKLIENHLNSENKVFDKWFRAYRVQTLALKGDTAEARRHLQALEEKGMAPIYLGWAYTGIGYTDKALSSYEKMHGDMWASIGGISGMLRLGEKYPEVRENPRYQKILESYYQAWNLNPDGSIPDQSGQNL